MMVTPVDSGSVPVKIKGIDVNEAVMNHLKELNLSKPTSKSKLVKRTDRFSVSQSSYDCYRNIFYSMIEPRQADASKLGTFTVGDIIHSIFQDVFKEIGGITEKGCGKSYFDDKIRIQGSADIVFADLVIEVKSVSPFAWKYVAGGSNKSGLPIIGSPKIHNVRQINSYLDILGIDEGILLYVNKDNLKTKSFEISRDKAIMQATIGRCVSVYNHIIENKVPMKVVGDECAWCNYKDLCKGKGEVSK